MRLFAVEGIDEPLARRSQPLARRSQLSKLDLTMDLAEVIDYVIHLTRIIR